MNSIERFRHNRNRDFERVKRLKRNLADSISVHMRQELAENPEATELRMKLLIPLGRVGRYLVVKHPDEVTSRIASAREISLSLDDTIEPPELVVRLGESIE